MGFPLSRGTLSNWIIKTSEEWLSPVVEKLREELLKDNTCMQTRLQFKYAPGRSGDNAKEFLKGFNGYLHTDGF